jgi:hypothetical protein
MQLKDRTEQSHGTWEEVYRNAKKADRLKNDLHERDDGELERTGQPLSIYEPYVGEGAWPFLHQRSLYRGVSLVKFVRECIFNCILISVQMITFLLQQHHIWYKLFGQTIILI